MARSEISPPASAVQAQAAAADGGETVSSVGSAVNDAGKTLYKDAVRASGAAAAAAKAVASEAGDGPFARAIKTGRRYSDGLYQHLRDWQDFHDGVHGDLGSAMDRTSGYQTRFNETLTGEAGDGVQSDLQANHRLWGAHQDKHQSASQAAHTAAWKVSNAQGEIDDLAEAGEREFNNAVRRRDPVAALDVYTRYSTDADAVVTKYHPEVVSLIQSAGFDVPLSPVHGDPGGPPGDSENAGDTGRNNPDETSPRPDEGTVASLGRNDVPASTSAAATGDLNGEKLPGDASRNDLPAGVPLNSGNSDASRNNPGSSLPQRIPQMPTGGSGGGGSAGSGGGGLASGLGSGTGSGMKPPGSVSSLPGANAGTSPASALSGGSPAQAGPSPLADAGSKFQSGLASGMGASGGMAPAMPQHDQPMQPMAAQQPMVAPSNAPVSPAGIQPAANWTPTPHTPTAGHGGAATGGGGGGMMPPAAMGAAQPLAPYSPAGSGAVGGGGGGPTSSAASGAAGASAGSPSASTSPAAAAPPLLAGNPGSSAAMAALAGTSRDLNPDVLLAQRVLGELVAGSDASTTLASWAVSVLRSPFGSRVHVASNMGGGWYLPASVYLPTTVKLAVADPALPAGWAAIWMGSQKPSRILIDHFARLNESANTTAGLAISALVTTDRAEPPSDFPGDYVVMEHMAARAMSPEAPVLDGAHRHRLATIHEGLADRVQRVAAGSPGAVLSAAAAITNVVYSGLKAQPDQLGTGQSMVTGEDERILDLVNREQASEEAWTAYDAAVQVRGGGAALWPEQFQGVQDNDDSDTARHAMRLYEHYYRTSRFIELINCWRRRPPALTEIAYCAITAGFGGAVLKTLTDAESREGASRP